MTRAQATKMVVLSRGWALLDPPTPSMTDVPRSHWGYRYIETAYSRGIVSRRGNGTFGPEEEITRAELSKILALGLQQGLRPGDPGPKAGPCEYKIVMNENGLPKAVHCHSSRSKTRGASRVRVARPQP